MARLTLNKSSLTAEQRRLKLLKQFLPSLDLKRRQLMAERAKARRQLATLDAQQTAQQAEIATQFPQLSTWESAPLVAIDSIDAGEDNVVGVRLPRINQVHFARVDYDFFATPVWLELLADALEAALQLAAERAFAQQRLALLEQAVVRITQRVNLFEKVLIPQAQENIRRVRLYLGEQERAAVIRAKLAKARQGVAP